MNIFPLLVAVRHPIARDQRAFERRYGGKDNEDMLDELHTRIGDVMMRKTKAECLTLPPKHRHYRSVDLPEAAQGEYLLQLDRARAVMGGGDGSVERAA